MNSSKPFLLIQSRPEDETSDNEYQAFCSYSGLDSSQLVRVRIDQQALPEIDLANYSGIMVGGGPFNFTTLIKTSAQKRIEKELLQLLDKVIDADFPFLGACYGVGLLTTHQDGKLSSQYAEPVGATRIQLVAEDPILQGIPEQFDAFLGHKEACEVLPAGAKLLASSATCPVQMFRIKQNVYATQFHPELDAEGLKTRINIYKDHGYFKPEDADALIEHGYQASVDEPMKVLENFVRLYR